MSRICNVCRIEQDLDNFHNCKSFPLGKVYTCKICAKAKTKSWNKENPEKKKQNAASHYLNNKEDYVERAAALAWAKNNPEKRNSSTRKRYWKNRAVNVAKIAEKRAAKFRATPKWLSEEQKQQINHIYHEATELTKATGIKHHVDHILPLNSPVVCGLHVPWNLRPLPAKENAEKGNRLLEELV